MRRVLITGASGFVGGELLRVLNRDDAILAISNSKACRDQVGWLETVDLDLAQRGASADIVARFRPTDVVHLAALSMVSVSYDDAPAVWRTNFDIAVELALALRTVPECRRFVFASTAHVYGEANHASACIDESMLPGPSGAYGRTKLAAEFALRDLLPPHIHCSILRLFNVIGPGQSAQFVASNFARQIALMEAGKAEPVLSAGNLHPIKDFVDVRDAARAFTAVLDARVPASAFEIYNVASGAGHSIQDLVDILQSQARIEFRVHQNPDRIRSAEMSRIVGNPGRLRAAFGWEPRFSLRSTLADTLDAWRRELAATAIAGE